MDDLLRLIPGYDPFASAGECWFDEATAQRAIDFFGHDTDGCLRHVEGDMRGKLFKLEPWQQAIVANLFGWKTKDAMGRVVRRYRESFIFCPRKQGKTPLVAGMALLVLFCDEEKAQQNYCAAADREQAGFLFRHAKGMVDLEPELSNRCRVYGGNAAAGQSKSIVREEEGSFLRVISADAETKHGGNSHFIVIDELHTQPNRDLVDVLQTSLASANRKQPLIVHVTTAGFDRNSICYEKYEYACRVRDGIINDPSFLPVIYEAPADSDWKSEDTWRIANPNLGVSVSLEYLKRECQKAIDSPAYQNTFKRLHLNTWCVTRETMIRLASGGEVRADALRTGDVIAAFDERTGAIVQSVVTGVVPMPASPIYTVTTSRGRYLRTNGCHPYWCRTGRSDSPRYEWVMASELRVGGRVGVALGHCSREVGGTSIPSSHARMLGMFAGDGTCNGTPRITTSDHELSDCFRMFVEELGDRFAPLPDGVHFDARNATATLKRTATRKFLQRHGMWRVSCYTKQVPDAVMRGGARVWSEFLSGYLDTDGHVGDGSIIWVSVSESLLRGSQALLTRLGIQSKLSVSGTRWRLEVLDADSFDIAVENLNPLVKRKRDALQRLGGRPRRTGAVAADRRDFDRIVSIDVGGDEETIGISVGDVHTHITNDLITHNTEQDVRWLDMDKWDACGAAFDVGEFEGRECYAGLDLASTNDIAALVLLFPVEA